MMRRRVFIDLDLDLLKDFFDYACQREEIELFNIFKDYDLGKYQGQDELDNALYIPETRLKISIRAVYYELMSIIEHEVQHVFSILPVNEIKRKDFLSKNNNLKSKKVWEINFYKLIKLIELKSEANIKDIPTYDTVKKIRKIANSLKHRKGLIDSKLDEIKTNKFPEFYKMEVIDAIKAISDTKEFFKSLYKSIGLENYY